MQCCMEQFAKQVFEFHTKGVKYDRHTSGTVWWTQFRDMPGVHGDAGAGIHWHW